MITYIFDGTLDGLFSAAVHAFRAKELPDRVIPSDEPFQPVLFEDVFEIETDRETAERGMKYLGRNLNLIIHAYLFDTGCDLAVLVRCLCILFKDAGYLNKLDIPDVIHVQKSAKRTLREKYRMVEFIRFKELNDSFLLAEIEPCANVLGLLADHLIKRLGSENWMIYDRLRRLLLVYSDKEANYYSDADMAHAPVFSSSEKHFQKLWQVFFDNIAIKERINPKLQKQHVPVKYRHLMTEFRSDS